MDAFFPARVLLVVIVLVAAASDIRTRRIPNWLTLPGVLAGILVNVVMAGLPGLKMSLTGLALAFGLYLVLYVLRAMGAGDVKLMAAVGAIVGPAQWFAIFIATAVAGGIFAVALMVIKGRVRQTLGNTMVIIQELAQFRAPYSRHKHLDVKDPGALNLPHGVAIATGTLVSLLLGMK